MLRIVGEKYNKKCLGQLLSRNAFKSFSTRMGIVQSQFQLKELDLNFVAMKTSFPKFMLDKMDSFGKNIAIMDGANNSMNSYESMVSDTYRLATTFRKMKINDGAVVGIISPNHKDYFTCVMAVGLNGGITTTVNPLYTEEEIEYQLSHTSARLVIAHSSCLEKAAKVAAKLNVEVVVLDLQQGSSNSISNLIHSTEVSGVDRHSFVDGRGDFDSRTPLIIPFSSGTTGKPKGVMLSHQNITANILQSLQFEGKGLTSHAGELQVANICPLPYFHIYGTLVVNLSFYSGAKHIYMPAFDLVKFLELIQEHRVQRAFIVPPIILALAKHPIVEKYDLSSLKCILSGAAPLGGELQALCESRLNVLIKQGWGMTELSPLGTGVPDDMIRQSATTKRAVLSGAAGLLAPNTDGKIVDPNTNEDLPPGQEGEVCIRGPQVMLGYYQNEEATSKMIDKDGWLHTGDVGYFNPDGFLFITDRCKELIKYKGFQVAPAELEAIIASMPGVADCVVIPVEDAEAGELPRAYVVRQDNEIGKELLAEHVDEYVKAKVAPHKRLRGGVRFSNVIPKSASGKILRRHQRDIDRAMDRNEHDGQK